MIIHCVQKLDLQKVLGVRVDGICLAGVKTNLVLLCEEVFDGAYQFTVSCQETLINMTVLPLHDVEPQKHVGLLNRGAGVPSTAIYTPRSQSEEDLIRMNLFGLRDTMLVKKVFMGGTFIVTFVLDLHTYRGFSQKIYDGGIFNLAGQKIFILGQNEWLADR